MIVLDDASDGQDRGNCSRDRLGLIAASALNPAPPLPPGWCGKQHACHVLSRLASHPDSAPFWTQTEVKTWRHGANDRVSGESGAALASGVPEQVTRSASERLLVPLIHFVLPGVSPIRRMRIDLHPALGAGCGQLFVAFRQAYDASGGHRAIRDTLHDGPKLPRQSFDQLASGPISLTRRTLPVVACFRREQRCGVDLPRNAGEGLGSPRLIGIATLLACRRPGSSDHFARGRLPEWVSLMLALSLAGTGAAFLPRARCPPISTAGRRGVASSDRNLCAPGNPMVCLFSLDGAATCHLEGSGVFFRRLQGETFVYSPRSGRASAWRRHRRPSN